jgi:DNA-cytosine methyltransferase
MNVLSLFDGMSCGQIALDRLNVDVDKYFASEINKYGIQVTQNNYPNTIQLGDITKIKGKELPKIDLFIGGSPCQGFSVSGKRLNFDDPRSKLFFEYLRLLKETEPRYFLLENVLMDKLYERKISNLLGVKPIMINSSLLSAQHRRRLYWSNIQIDPFPEDKELFLKDIIEQPNEKYDITEKFLKTDKNTLGYKKAVTAIRNKFQKSRTLLASGVSFGCNGATNIIKNGRYYKLTPVECERLQTVPDNYTNCVSENQRYTMLGNGWTVDVICHILSEVYR